MTTPCAVVDARGREIVRRTVEHTAAGLRELVAVLRPRRRRRGGDRTPRRAGRRRPARRRAHRGGDQPEPGQEPARPLRLGRQQGRPVRRLRAGRHAAHRPGPAAPLVPDSPATVTLRQACRARKDLVTHRVAVANQLRAHLRIVFPGAVGLFADLDSADQPGVPGPLRLPGPRRLALAQTAGRLAGQRRLQRPHRPRRAARPADRRAPRRHRRPTAPPRPTSPAPCVAVLTSLVEQIKALSDARSPSSSPATPTRTSSPACPAPAPSAPPGCSPRSATAEPGSPPPNR